MWHAVLAGPAAKALDRIPARDHARIRAALDALEIDPLAGDVRKLKAGLMGFRRRVGDWRIFFDLEQGRRRVVVTAIERRTSTTY